MASVSGRLSPAQIGSAMRRAGWPEAAIPVGIAVAMAESGGNPNATNKNRNGSTDYGLFQINSIHGSLVVGKNWSDPVENARMALKLYKDSGWKPWVAYNSGSYRKNLDAAAKGAQESRGGGSAALPPETGPDLSGYELHPYADASGAGAVWNALTSPELWNKVLTFLLAVFLIIVGTTVLLRKPIAVAGKAGVKATTKGLI